MRALRSLVGRIFRLQNVETVGIRAVRTQVPAPNKALINFLTSCPHLLRHEGKDRVNNPKIFKSRRPRIQRRK